MTSANVNYYQVFKDGKLVKEHSQHNYCVDKIKEELQKYVPATDYTLIVRWPDEEEEDHFSVEMSLDDYLSRRKRVEWGPEMYEVSYDEDREDD